MLRDAFPSDIVGRPMADTNIFLCTPNRVESRRARSNETMANGCVIVANSITGLTPYLTENGLNNLVFDLISVDSSYEAVKQLPLDSALRERLRKKHVKQS